MRYTQGEGRHHEEQIMAKSMVCGFCSEEQSLKSECSRCGKQVTQVAKKSGFLEGKLMGVGMKLMVVNLIITGLTRACATRR